ncbi:MAG TPA: MmcQ/YjbR family DNA-binding protein [Chthoniobacterales bacterium]|nr:MmcQ/YjbR family DNA-binding protein [Chthoniobacterales bacterium]
MTADDFRDIALSFPEAREASHMGHPDFRVGGKVFATLGYPDDKHGVVILPQNEQANVIAVRPNTFSPVRGFWGRRGATQVLLKTATAPVLRSALAAAWRRVAPKRLAHEHEDRS